MTDEERWAGLVATGLTKCARCAEYIRPEVESWQLAEDNGGWVRPEHVQDCKADG